MGFQKDQVEKIELLRVCEEDRRITHTAESPKNGYAMEKEERMTKNTMERYLPGRTKTNTGLRAGEHVDRATWSREIISHTDDTR